MSASRQFRAGAAAGVVGLMALCGCGDSSVTVNPPSSTSSFSNSTTSTATPSSSTTPIAPTTTSSSTTSTTSSATSEGPAALAGQLKDTSAVDPADYKGSVTDVGFQSPSGNIGCGFTSTPSARVVCQIETFTFASPAGNCHGGGDGGAIVFARGSKPSFACLGDLESGGPTLSYGSKITVGAITCASQTGGITCVAGPSHGFQLAKERYTLS